MFQTCFGRFRWFRRLFGISVSSEIFQRRLLDALSDLHGVTCIADYVIIHGKTLKEHDHHLDQFLKRCQEKNIQLNKNKFTLHSEGIRFMGHLTTKDGLQTDREQIRAITDFPEPQNLEELPTVPWNDKLSLSIPTYPL